VPGKDKNTLAHSHWAWKGLEETTPNHINHAVVSKFDKQKRKGYDLTWTVESHTHTHTPLLWCPVGASVNSTCLLHISCRVPKP
jgi:hypothetical protein